MTSRRGEEGISIVLLKSIHLIKPIYIRSHYVIKEETQRIRKLMMAMEMGRYLFADGSSSSSSSSSRRRRRRRRFEQFCVLALGITYMRF